MGSNNTKVQQISSGDISSFSGVEQKEFLKWASSFKRASVHTEKDEWIAGENGELRPRRLLMINCHIRELSPSIGSLESLVTIDLSGNKMKLLPPRLCELVNLQSLNVADNCLSKIPDTLGLLRQLKELNVSGNTLKWLPMSIGSLTELHTLHARSNHIASLPHTVGNLKKLTTLHLSHNKLSALPGSFLELGSLKELSLSGNQFDAVPQEIALMPKLRKCDLWLNNNPQRHSVAPQTFTRLTRSASTTFVPGEGLPGKSLIDSAQRTNNFVHSSSQISKSVNEDANVGKSTKFQALRRSLTEPQLITGIATALSAGVSGETVSKVSQMTLLGSPPPPPVLPRKGSLKSMTVSSAAVDRVLASNDLKVESFEVDEIHEMVHIH
eukprot:GFYU01021033.1.p1 GENE.GFYU01021033.1~~GFYU01021033.1.p1  ORF type:complete len:383 (-),score=89.02 GFYU01021033.1:85-1233(-)